MSRRSRSLADACALLPGILEQTPAGLPRGCLIDDARATATDMALIRLAVPSRPPAAFVKLPLSPAAARGLDRETAALADLHADARLGDWRALLPLPLASGTVHGRPYRIDSALPGHPPAAATPALEEGAAEVIHVLHRATASRVSGDALAARWVDEPLRELERHRGLHGAAAVRAERLREELHGALAGRRLSAGWIHGDYWLGNLLLADGRVQPAGIADWEGSGTPELPLHDVVHLILSARRTVSGEQLGGIVRRQLAGAGWSPRERRLLDRYAACGLADRHVVLLYWLRQAALHARQQSRLGGARHRVWERRNVHAVLAAL